MAYSIGFDPEQHFVHIIVKDNLTMDVAQAIVAESTRVAQENDCHIILNDMRQAEIKLSTSDFYEIRRSINNKEADQNLNEYKMRRAIVTQGEDQGMRFFELFNTNRGYQFKVFTDIDEAMKWLLRKQ